MRSSMIDGSQLKRTSYTTRRRILLWIYVEMIKMHDTVPTGGNYENKTNSCQKTRRNLVYILRNGLLNGMLCVYPICVCFCSRCVTFNLQKSFLSFVQCFLYSFI